MSAPATRRYLEHVLRFQPEDSVALGERAWMPEGWARGQLVRHRRVPLQGLTYSPAGAPSRRSSASTAETHAFRAWLLARGPIAPPLLAGALPR